MKRDPWEVWESDVQSRLDLRGTISSGNKFYDPSDGVDKLDHTESDFRLMVDAKCTKNPTYRVGYKQLAQWVEKSQSMGFRFALPIRLLNGEAEKNTDYVVCTLDDFAELLERYRETEREVRAEGTEESEAEQLFTEEEKGLILGLSKAAPSGIALELLAILEKMDVTK